MAGVHTSAAWQHRGLRAAAGRMAWALVLFIGCGARKEARVAADDVAAALQRTSYMELFESDSPRQGQILAMPDARKQLHDLVLAPGAPLTTRFLAAELLASDDAHYPPAAEQARVAEVYARALASGEPGNRWGLPGHGLGAAGEHCLRLGAAALAALRPLLDDARPMAYWGSQEPTLAKANQLRVKDVAAMLVARLVKQEEPHDRDPAVRDKAIDALKSAH